MKYRLLESKRKEDLIDAVKHWIKFGWEPQGGVSHTTETYMQAMIKRSENHEY